MSSCCRGANSRKMPDDWKQLSFARFPGENLKRRPGRLRTSLRLLGTAGVARAPCLRGSRARQTRHDRGGELGFRCGRRWSRTSSKPHRLCNEWPTVRSAWPDHGAATRSHRNEAALFFVLDSTFHTHSLLRATLCPNQLPFQSARFCRLQGMPCLSAA